jgi:hypothetical protein
LVGTLSAANNIKPRKLLSRADEVQERYFNQTLVEQAASAAI